MAHLKKFCDTGRPKWAKFQRTLCCDFLQMERWIFSNLKSGHAIGIFNLQLIFNFIFGETKRVRFKQVWQRLSKRFVWPTSGLFFFTYFFIFNKVDRDYNSLMIGFEPGISAVGSDLSTHCATTTACRHFVSEIYETNLFLRLFSRKTSALKAN